MPPNVMSFDLMTVIGDDLGTIRIGNDGTKLVMMIRFANGKKQLSSTKPITGGRITSLEVTKNLVPAHLKKIGKMNTW